MNISRFFLLTTSENIRTMWSNVSQLGIDFSLTVFSSRLSVSVIKYMASIQKKVWLFIIITNLTVWKPCSRQISAAICERILNYFDWHERVHLQVSNTNSINWSSRSCKNYKPVLRDVSVTKNVCCSSREHKVSSQHRCQQPTASYNFIAKCLILLMASESSCTPDA